MCSSSHSSKEAAEATTCLNSPCSCASPCARFAAKAPIALQAVECRAAFCIDLLQGCCRYFGCSLISTMLLCLQRNEKNQHKLPQNITNICFSRWRFSLRQDNHAETKKRIPSVLDRKADCRKECIRQTQSSSSSGISSSRRCGRISLSAAIPTSSYGLH